jgi:hypothetical protein
MYVQAPSVDVPRSIVLFAALTYGVLALAALIRPVFAPPSDQGPNHTGQGSPMIIGDRVRAIHKSRNLSQTKPGAKAGVADTLICRIENSLTVPAAPVFEQLAETLEVPLCGLFYDPSNSPAWFPN